jgi:hypothetical protein
LKTRILVFVLLLIASAAFAQEASLKDLQPFVGTFKCTGMAFASEMGPEHPTRGAVTGKWALGGKWLEIRYTEEKTSKNAHPFAVVAYWGFDEATKKLVAPSMDNMGGYAMGEATGWTGDQLVFTGLGHMGPMTMQGRDVFTRKGKNQITHSFEMQDNAGGWKKLDEETCKK